MIKFNPGGATGTKVSLTGKCVQREHWRGSGQELRRWGESTHWHSAAEFMLCLSRHGREVSGLLPSPPPAALFTPTLTISSTSGHQGLLEGNRIFPGISLYALQSRTHILRYVQVRALEAHIEIYTYNCPLTPEDPMLFTTKYFSPMKA